MKQTTNLKVTSPAPRDAWRDLLARDRSALLYQTPEWMDCICEAGGFEDATRLYELPGGRSFILPLASSKALPGMAVEASLPHGWGMGGMITAAKKEPELARLVFQDMAERRVFRATVRPSPFDAELWASAAPLTGFSRQRHSSHILDISEGFDYYWMKTLSTSTRTKIRKAEKSGLEISSGPTEELLPVFYDLYMGWIERRGRERNMPLFLARALGKWREPLKKFQTVARTLGPSCRAWVARYEGRPAAASILLIYKDHAFYWRNASDKELATPTRANDLIQRSMIEYACQQGCRWYHFGESGGVESLIHFKERMGGVEYPYDEYSIERLPVTALQDRVYGLVRRAEKKALSKEGI